MVVLRPPVPLLLRSRPFFCLVGPSTLLLGLLPLNFAEFPGRSSKVSSTFLEVGFTVLHLFQSGEGKEGGGVVSVSHLSFFVTSPPFLLFF